MIPSPYGRQRPTTTRASARPRSSRASRDFPIPGGPTIVASCGVRVSTATARALARARSSSSPRPTNGRVDRARERRHVVDEPEHSERQNRARACPSARAARPPPSGLRRGRGARSPSRCRTSPASAACSSRAATFTASPVASVSPVPATTSPVLTPMRTSSPRAATASRISTAARTARSASSS